jgi:hypothetical protein
MTDTTGEGPQTLTSERLRLLSELADREALDNARRRGEVIEYRDAEDCMLALVTILTSRLDGVAGRLANELVNEPNAAIIRDKLLTEHRRIRTAVSAGLIAFKDECAREAALYE